MEEFDIKEFARLFDAALASDNPSVKKALRNFMMIAAVVHAEEQTSEGRSMGSLETLVKKVSDLERMVYEMHTTRMTQDSYKDYYKQWCVNQTSFTSGSGSWKDSLGYSAVEISELLKDIKIK